MKHWRTEGKEEDTIMKKRLVAMAMAGCMALSLVACGGASSTATTAAAAAATSAAADSAAASGDTIAAAGDSAAAGDIKTIESGVLTVGMSADYAPFDWLQNDASNDAVMTTNGSYMNGQSLKALDLRKSNCMVISVMRSGEMITNPKADFVFQPGDKVWVAGEFTSVNYLTKSE